MKKLLTYGVIILITGLGLSFILYSLMIASSPPQAAEPPVLSESPARVYGAVEPAGREVFVSPPVTKEVVQIFVKEGDTVRKGQVLCLLDNDVERAELALAEAKVASAERSIDITSDDMSRKKTLYSQKVDSEFGYTQSRLKKELDVSNLRVALREVELATARLKELEMTSPVDGKVYKFDVRLGETLASGDITRIIVGSPDLWVRFFIESFWIDRIAIGSRYKIYHSETNQYLGSGQVLSRAPYMGRRDFRTEDVQERFDTKFQEVVLSFTAEKNDIPIGLSVVAELVEEGR
jgi:multidrug efflux pump subunit AcrA (membrane-fusion protein)